MRHPSTHALGRAALAALMLLCCAAHARARQTTGATPSKDTPASVAGRVTRDEDGKSAPGVVVMLAARDPNVGFKVVARATTDAEGRYRLSNVAPGRYQLAPMSPAHVVKDMNWSGWPPGRPVTIGPGEHLEEADFRLTRGGVITGRVTDADGKPVVAERVEIAPADKKQGLNLLPGYGMRNMTDDRGVYRVYGLPGGRYHVSVGQDRESGVMRFGGPNRYYQRTYHPATTDAAQARVVEVGPGAEAKDVDIVVAPAAKTYKASGRIVSAETGQPVPDVMFAYGALSEEGKRVGAWGVTGVRTNARGEFTIEGLTPGHYAAFASSFEAADWYSDAVSFEVEDEDVSGLEVKIRRGASLSGVVRLEGVSDPAARARLLAQLTIDAFPAARREELTSPEEHAGRVNADGTFRIAGMRPGRYKLTLSSWRTPKGVSLVRVEHNGVEASGGVEVGEGAQVTGLRVQLAYGTGVVRGQVNTAAGAPATPPGARMTVAARRIVNGQAIGTAARASEVDARGRFALEDLAPGEYLIVLRVNAPGAEVIDVRQTVTLGESGEASVVLVIK